jgi:hypothetical protein
MFPPYRRYVGVGTLLNFSHVFQHLQAGFGRAAAKKLLFWPRSTALFITWWLGTEGGLELLII